MSRGDQATAAALANSADCDINTVVNGFSTLMSASSKGQGEIVRFVLSLPGVDVHKRTADGRTALHLAAADGHLEATQVLVQWCGSQPAPEAVTAPEGEPPPAAEPVAVAVGETVMLLTSPLHHY